MRAVAGLLILVLTGCSAQVAPAMSLGGSAPAVAPESAAAPARTAKITTIRTTDSTKGVITVIGSLTPAPKAGTRIPLHQWIPAEKRWQEIAHGYSAGSSVTIKTVQPGSVRTYRIAVGPQAPYPAAISPVISLKHYVWRGIFKRGMLAAGGKGAPQFNVVPPNEGPRRAEADLLANKGGFVWGDVDSTGCSYVRNWLGNLTDGTVRVSLHNGTKAITSVRQAQETETWLNAKILGITRLRLQVTDINSGYGPYVSVDSIMLCTN
ncbi:hypothetical protein E0H73_24310 [Kribbella pittospori]|uniref:Glycosyl hydrolase family 98 putative carbohydrate-binding module domain-containing protein n=1 Tax=Kribbella pittospori TaxID=722689 RepID=A0A4R0KGW3_9ACTN|nr:hypothetical protein [Kribbella pittospori]TCC59743.1 hypothetical protein E0H73_24310 [Kribbella pittospori]